MSNNTFLLTKWYLDCVAENGDSVIVYVAELRWNTLSFHYASALTVFGGKVSSASAVRGICMPLLSGECITLRQPALNLEGQWRALRPAIRRAVLQTPQGHVDWHCLQPMSEVEMLFRGKTEVKGLGYAECLTVSLLPWQLPLTELNWGRYLSTNDALVWIDWQGPEPQRHVIHNGNELRATSVTDSELAFGNGTTRLELDRGLVLREGALGDTVLPGISRLARLLPRTMLLIHECKWRSRGLFRSPTGESSGWAIHEVVKWKD